MIVQVQALQIIGYIFEIIAIVAGLLTATYIFVKRAKYLGNIFMGLGNLFIGVYVLFILLYDYIGEAWAILTFLPIAMCCIMLGTMFVFFSMMCFVNSDKWFKIWYHWLPFIAISAAYSIYILTNQTFIEILDTELVNTKLDLIPLAILVVILLFYLGSSEYLVVVHGIKKTTGSSKQKMKRFSGGIIVGIIAILINILSQILANETIGTSLDVLFFATLAICVILLTLAIIRK